MFSIGRASTPPMVTQIPVVSKLRERNVRSGYFEYEEYLKLKAELPDHLKPLLTVAYFTGLRRGELLSLKWSQVDIFGRKITLEAGTTKNDEARVIYLDGELFETMLTLKKVHDLQFVKCPYVFSHNGEPLRDFRDAWASACDRPQIGHNSTF